MKKVERFIYLIIIVVLVGFLAAGGTYIALQSKNNNVKDNNKVNNEQNNNSKTEDDKKQEENTKPEKVTLKEEELEKYLGYVPNYQHEETMIAYNYQKIDINSIHKRTLIAMALTEAYYDCGEKSQLEHKDYCLMTKNKVKYLYEEEFETIISFSLDYINERLEKMYNYKITSLEETIYSDNAYRGAHGSYAYQDGYFLMVANGIGDTNRYLSEMSKYEATKNELIIWEYRSYYDSNTSSSYKLMDYLKSNIGEFKTEKEAEEYFKNNKNKFTEYKHTFKKNSTGYYWYSTEVVN